MRALKMYLNILAENFKMRVRTGQWISILLIAVTLSSCGDPVRDSLLSDISAKAGNFPVREMTDEEIDHINYITDKVDTAQTNESLRSIYIELKEYSDLMWDKYQD